MKQPDLIPLQLFFSPAIYMYVENSFGIFVWNTFQKKKVTSMQEFEGIFHLPDSYTDLYFKNYIYPPVVEG